MDFKRLIFSTGLLLGLLPLSAQAERMNFAFIQVTGQTNTEVDTAGLNGDGDGLGIRGSWIYGPYAFMDIRYDDTDLNKGLDMHHAAARLGARTDIDLQAPVRLDIYAMLTLEDVELEREVGNVETEFLDDSGVGIVFGARFGPIYPLELGLEYSFTDFGNDDAQFLSVEGIWNVANWLGLVLEYRDGSYNIDNRPDVDRSDLNIGVRWQFGGDVR